MEQELGTERSRNRRAVIGQLTGGHPRLWMLFADCTSVESLDELVPMFLKAMDDLTAYYQARMRELGGQQDEIVAFLCAAGGARTVAQIALECGIPAKSTAVQLAKLVETGFVRLVELAGLEHSGDRRKTFYELRDPLMRLCLDVKVSRGESLRLVVEFLRAWSDSSSLSMTVETNGLEIWAGKLVDTVEYRIATAVLAWRADHDRSHLLQLAVEERAVASTLLGLTCSPAGAV